MTRGSPADEGVRPTAAVSIGYARILSIGRQSRESLTFKSRTRQWLSQGEERYGVVMGMTLNIPDSVLLGLRLPEGEIVNASGPNWPSRFMLKERSRWERHPNSQR